jgi:hypothetical protein
MQLETSRSALTSILGVALIFTAISIVFRKWILNAFASLTARLDRRGTILFTICRERYWESSFRFLQSEPALLASPFC